MDKCAKCGRPDDGWLVASVDINDILCINCSDRFNEWCDTHPGEPYQNFLQPKPWEPKFPAIIIAPREEGPTTLMLPTDPIERQLWAIFGF